MCRAHTVQRRKKRNHCTSSTKAQAVSRPLDTLTFPKRTNTTVRVHKPMFAVLRQATLCAETGLGGKAVWVSRTSTNYENTACQERPAAQRPTKRANDTGHCPTPLTTPRALQDAALRLGATRKDVFRHRGRQRTDGLEPPGQKAPRTATTQFKWTKARGQIH